MADAPPSSRTGWSLAELGAFLASERLRPGTMGLSELDGLLAILAAGPMPMPAPEAWMPLVWNGGDPDFCDLAEVKASVFAIMERLMTIYSQLREEPETYRPVFDMAEGAECAMRWGQGFLAGMALRPAAWDQLLATELGHRCYVTLLTQMPEPTAGLPMSLDAQGLAVLRRQGRERIPAAVIAICGYWREHEAGRSSTPR
jgi:yecA family protein